MKRKLLAVNHSIPWVRMTVLFSSQFLRAESQP